MNTVKLTIAYDGTDYKGWQIQPNGKTVQGEIEKSIRKIFGKDHRLHGTSRTDSGVHAACQVAHFKATRVIPIAKMADALNSALPKDIVILKAEYADTAFHARFDTKSKLYSYKIFFLTSKRSFSSKICLVLVV